MSVRSMTGYARIRQSIPESKLAGEISVAIKSVNHRGLDLHFHMTSLFDPVEAVMRNFVKQHASRGHVDIRVHLQRSDNSSALKINRDLLSAYRSLFVEAEAEFGPMGVPNLNEALRIPGMMIESRDEDLPAEVTATVMACLADAVAEWNGQREREGGALATQLRQYNASIRSKALQIRSFRGHILPMLKDRIEGKITELLSASSVDPVRLAQEAAYLADRGDIEEEITRLLTHIQHLETLLSGSGETGKKVDFILQEMNREANTILSKASNSGDYGLQITELGLGVKTEIERIREQSLNLE